MHIHGTEFYITGTEGGRVPKTAWYPGNTVLVGVAQARDIEFDAVNGGFARNVTAELWRSFDQVELYHQNHMDMMQTAMRSQMSGTQTSAMMNHSSAVQTVERSQAGGQMNNQTPAQMAEMMRQMEACLTQLSAHLIELERETGAANPNPKRALEQRRLWRLCRRQMVPVRCQRQ